MCYADNTPAPPCLKNYWYPQVQWGTRLPARQGCALSDGGSDYGTINGVRLAGCLPMLKTKLTPRGVVGMG